MKKITMKNDRVSTRQVTNTGRVADRSGGAPKSTAGRVGRAVMIAVVVVATVVGHVSPASAAIVDTDTVRMNGNHTDFASGSHAWGNPAGRARIEWGDNRGGNQWVEVKGTLYSHGFFLSCGEVRIDFFNSAQPNNIIQTRTAEACRFSFTPTATTNIDVGSSNTRINRVRICTRNISNDADARCLVRGR